MSEQTQTEPLANFVCDLGKVATSRPCPINGAHVARLIKLELKPAKPDANTGVSPGNNLFMTFAFLHDCQAIADKTGQTRIITAGYELTECCVMWQPANPKAPDWKVKVARIYDALAGTNDENRPEQLDWAGVYGKPLTLYTEAEDSVEFGLQPRIKKYGPPPVGL